MPNYQLVKRNEYGETQIQASSADYMELVQKGKDFVTQDNIENALTYDEKLKDWESYFVDLFDEDDLLIENAVYGGKNGRGEDIVLLVLSDNVVQQNTLDNTSVNLKVFIGYDDSNYSPKNKDSVKGNLYAKDPKGKLITTLSNSLLEEKSFYYITKR